MRNNTRAGRALWTLMCALVILATLAQGALAREGPELEVTIEDTVAETGAAEAVVEISDEVILEDGRPPSEEIALDGLDESDLIDEGLTLEDAFEETPVEPAPDAGELSSNDGGETASFDYIAYSSVNGIGDAPINTAAHYIKCCSPEYAFTTIKGDVQLTSDNRIVMCHDPGFTLSESGRIKNFRDSNMVEIHSLTYAQCMALQYERPYRKEYVGVCDFETYIDICARYNKSAFITIRDLYIPELLNEMMPIIYRYNMQSRCTINSFTLESLELVRAYDPSIRLSFVVEGGVPTEADSDAAARLGNCLLTLYVYPTPLHGGIDLLLANQDKLAYARGKGLWLYIAVITRENFTQQLTDLGISGAQFNEAPFGTMHAWQPPVYTWSQSNRAVTAERTCAYDATHVERERVKTVSEVARPATEEAAGELVYTAVFNNPAFEPQRKAVEIPMLEPVIVDEVAAKGGQYLLNHRKMTATFKVPARKTVRHLNICDTVDANRATYTVTSIADGACEGLDALVAVTIGANVKGIGNRAFAGCPKLRTVRGGDSVTDVGKEAFLECASLAAVPALTKLERVKASAFKGCRVLRAIALDTRVKSIGVSAFEGCTRLKTITVRTRLLTRNNVGTGAFTGIHTAPRVLCPKRMLDAYRNLFKRKGIPEGATYDSL